jgi:N-acetylglutamate synthase-like GNAT family acetyltransferase
MRIRSVGPDDAPQLVALTEQLGYSVSIDVMRSRLGEVVRDTSRQVIVAVHEGHVIAWMELGIMHAIESGSWGEIRGLVVDEAFRSRGVGEAMTREAARWAGKQGLPKVRVRTNEIRTRTHAFYAKCGFTHVKTQRVFEMPVDSAVS